LHDSILRKLSEWRYCEQDEWQRASQIAKGETTASKALGTVGDQRGKKTNKKRLRVVNRPILIPRTNKIYHKLYPTPTFLVKCKELDVSMLDVS
jgi:hypothetical protein